MKIALSIVILSVTLLACQKQATNNLSTDSTISGNWKMILVEDNQSGSATTKPTSIQGDVVITFSSFTSTPGKFYGYTPANEISPSDYTVSANHLLTVLNLAMTKVGETSWGAEFVDNIRDAKSYSFEKNGNLDIKTAARTLVFQRQ